MDFKLHPKLAVKIFIADLPLCKVMLEDEGNYPWLFLIPRINDASRMMDLTPEDQLQLMKEMDLAQKILWDEYQPDQINVAAIGNKTPQLHVHIIARFITDPAWPGTVWDHPVRSKLSAESKEAIVETLKARFHVSGNLASKTTNPSAC